MGGTHCAVSSTWLSPPAHLQSRRLYSDTRFPVFAHGGGASTRIGSVSVAARNWLRLEFDYFRVFGIPNGVLNYNVTGTRGRGE